MNQTESNGNELIDRIPEDVHWIHKKPSPGPSEAWALLGISNPDILLIRQTKDHFDFYNLEQDFSEDDVDRFRKAAEKGKATAQFSLGVMYQTGHGARRDYAEAVRWYQKAAEQGFAKAQHNLGAMYMSDSGVDQDWAEAVYWFKKAAYQGVPAAQTFLGCMYLVSDENKRDDETAYVWLSIATKNGMFSGRVRDEVAERLSPAEIAAADQKAWEFHRRIEMNCDVN